MSDYRVVISVDYFTHPESWCAKTSNFKQKQKKQQLILHLLFLVLGLMQNNSNHVVLRS